MTVVTSTDTAVIYLANSSTTNGRFETNNTFRDTRYTNRVYATINSSMTIWMRGIYNWSGKVQGVVLANGSASITDEAGNPLSNSTGIKDIYDNVLTFSADTNGMVDWTGFSIPHWNINSTPISNALSAYTSQFYTHNGTQWVSTTVGNLNSLRGYQMKVTGLVNSSSLEIPVQTKTKVNPNSADSVTTEYGIDAGWALISVDGYDDNVGTDVRVSGEWLSSLGVGSNSKVANLLNVDDTSSTIDPGVVATGTILPYRAYWVNTNPSGSGTGRHLFSGNARW